MGNSFISEKITSLLQTYHSDTGLSSQFLTSLQLEDLSGSLPPCAFCMLMHSDPTGKLQCYRQKKAASQNAALTNTWQIFACHAGLAEWVVPVYSKDDLQGFIFSGFVCNENSGKQSLEDQYAIFNEKYHITHTDFLESLDSLTCISKNNAEPYAQLLQSLVQINGLAKAVPISYKTVTETPEDVIGFQKEFDNLQEIPKAHPLSYYIDNSKTDPGVQLLFWRTIETKAGTIFNLVMSGHMLEGHSAYDEIMQLAYDEETLEYAKTSAEMLFHIILLKYYSKDFFNTRFYKLVFDTINQLKKASSISQIREHMSASYKQLYLFYNTKDALSNDFTISKVILKYLEENYSKPLKIEDIGTYLYMSPAYLSRLFKSETGITIKQSLTNIRMRHAQNLLINTTMSVKDIGYSVGYQNDLRGFYKMFNKHFGMTCSQMRKNNFYISEI